MPVETDAPFRKAENTAGSQELKPFVFAAHGMLRDLQRPNPAIFWTDFLVTITVAYSAFAVYQFAPDYTALQAVSFILSGVAIYRAVVFIHEISHRPPGTFGAFTCIWNLLCGIPVLMPSFLYGDHKSHHSHHSYGTHSDAEYVFLSHGRRRAIVFLLLPFVYPLLGPLRFLLLTPAAVLIPGFDRLVWTCASSLYMMNPAYRRQYDLSAHTLTRWLQEGACCLWIWSITWLTWTARVPFHAAVKTYLVFVFWMGLNQLRTLAAHRYGSDGNVRESVEQVLDSNTFARGRFLPGFWAPLGLRYHALHHLMPSLPYHAMGRAHRQLITSLPAESPYHKTLQRGIWSCFRLASSSTGGCHAGNSHSPPPKKR
jgi:fatty acid desaturase